MEEVSEKAISELESLGFDYNAIKDSQREVMEGLTLFHDRIIVTGLMGTNSGKVNLGVFVDNAYDQLKVSVGSIYADYYERDPFDNKLKFVCDFTFKSSDSSIPMRDAIPDIMRTLKKTEEVRAKFRMNNSEDVNHQPQHKKSRRI